VRGVKERQVKTQQYDRKAFFSCRYATAHTKQKEGIYKEGESNYTWKWVSINHAREIQKKKLKGKKKTSVLSTLWVAAPWILEQGKNKEKVVKGKGRGKGRGQSQKKNQNRFVASERVNGKNFLKKRDLTEEKTPLFPSPEAHRSKCGVGDPG